MTNATSVAKTSPQKNIACSKTSDDEGAKSSASSRESQRDEENYHVDTGKRYLEKRGKSVWLKGLHPTRIFEMRSHLIPRSM